MLHIGNVKTIMCFQGAVRAGRCISICFDKYVIAKMIYQNRQLELINMSPAITRASILESLTRLMYSISNSKDLCQKHLSRSYNPQLHVLIAWVVRLSKYNCNVYEVLSFIQQVKKWEKNIGIISELDHNVFSTVVHSKHLFLVRIQEDASSSMASKVVFFFLLSCKNSLYLAPERQGSSALLEAMLKTIA